MDSTCVPRSPSMASDCHCLNTWSHSTRPNRRFGQFQCAGLCRWQFALEIGWHSCSRPRALRLLQCHHRHLAYPNCTIHSIWNFRSTINLSKKITQLNHYFYLYLFLTFKPVHSEIEISGRQDSELSSGLFSKLL